MRDFFSPAFDLAAAMAAMAGSLRAAIECCGTTRLAQQQQQQQQQAAGQARRLQQLSSHVVFRSVSAGRGMMEMGTSSRRKEEVRDVGRMVVLLPMVRAVNAAAVVTEGGGSVAVETRVQSNDVLGKPTVLVAEKLGEAGIALLRKVANVDCSYNLTPQELCSKISLCDALIVRSGTKVTREVFEASNGRLKVRDLADLASCSSSSAGYILWGFSFFKLCNRM